MKKYNSPTILKLLIFPVFTFLCCGAFVLRVEAQAKTQREIAVITDATGNKRVIRYADLLIKLALEPAVPLDSPPGEDLKRALQSMIDLVLISLELESVKVPCSLSNETDTKGEVQRIAKLFSSFEEFENRLRAVGFHSARDYRFEQLMGGLAVITKYLNIRFRAFIIIPAEDELKYYREIFAPDFRRKNPGILLPELQQTRPQIRQILIEQRAQSEIKRFLERARRQVRIEILSEDLK